MRSAPTLRSLLADTATRLGPDAPTLDDPWRVRDLVAHLVLRETRPDALPGIGLPLTPLRRHTAALQTAVAADGFAATVERLRTGPPRWSPGRTALWARVVDLPEHAVHLEDMVRAQEGWRPTRHDPAVAAALWASVRLTGPVLYRSAPTGVVAVAPGHGRVVLRRPRSGSGTVVLRGSALEVLLHAFGRTRASLVSVEGGDEDVAALARHRRAL